MEQTLFSAIREIVGRETHCVFCADGAEDVDLTAYFTTITGSIWVCAACWREHQVEIEHSERFKGRAAGFSDEEMASKKRKNRRALWGW